MPRGRIWPGTAAFDPPRRRGRSINVAEIPVFLDEATAAVPVIGVLASALALQEPLGIGQITALLFTLADFALATRS